MYNSPYLTVKQPNYLFFLKIFKIAFKRVKISYYHKNVIVRDGFNLQALNKCCRSLKMDRYAIGLNLKIRVNRIFFTLIIPDLSAQNPKVSTDLLT